MKTVLGIDQAKKKFDVALLRNGKYRSKAFENNPAGFSELLATPARRRMRARLLRLLSGRGVAPGGRRRARCLGELGHCYKQCEKPVVSCGAVRGA